MSDPFLVEHVSKITTITLNRPEKGNAYDGAMAEGLSVFLRTLRCDILVIRARGKHFCTGADLNWMSRGPSESVSQSEAEMRHIFRMYEAFLSLSCPVVSFIQGKVRGGGLGIVSVSDYAYAVPEADFALPEKKLGLVPGIIAPLLRNKIGEEKYLSLEEGGILSAEAAVGMKLIDGIGPDLPSISGLVKRVESSPALLREMESKLVESAERRRHFSRK